MADLVKLIFAEDNETLVRKDTNQKVNTRPVGKPVDILAYSGHMDEKIKSIAWSPSYLDGYAKADAYVERNSLGTMKSSEGEQFIVPIQYYKILNQANEAQ